MIARPAVPPCSFSRVGDFAVKSDNDAASIEQLIESLNDADQVVRLHAATVLGSFGHDAERAVPALIQMLTGGDVHDRKLAALTLGEIGPAAEDAVPALLDAANDDDDGVSSMAIWALEEIDLTESNEQAA
jgi:HEAT repeat protein